MPYILVFHCGQFPGHYNMMRSTVGACRLCRTVGIPCADPEKADKMPETIFKTRQMAGRFAILVGVALALAAIWTLFNAPEGATVLLERRAGRHRYEAGLWALFVMPFLALFMAWYGLREKAEVGTRRPGLVILIALVAAAGLQYSLITGVMGW